MSKDNPMPMMGDAVNYFEFPPVDDIDQGMREAQTLIMAGLLKFEEVVTNEIVKDGRASEDDMELHAKTALELMALTKTMLANEEWWKYYTEYVKNNVTVSVSDLGL